MQYKMVFVDWDGTLSSSRFWSRWRDSLSDGMKYDAIQKVLFTEPEGRLLLDSWMRGFKTYVNVLNYVADATGIPYDDLVDELRYSAENMDFIDANSMILIRELRGSGVKVLIATDNMDTFSYWTVPALNLALMFDGIIASNAIGALKTDAHDDGTSMFFGHYLCQNAIRPEETVLMDDNSDKKAVERFGMNFLHVNETRPLTAHLQGILKGVN